MKPEETITILMQMRNATDKSTHPDETIALDEAIACMSRRIPKKVIRNGDWSSVTCPVCNMELSTHIGDGCYSDNDWLEYCPNDECHQRLNWAE